MDERLSWQTTQIKINDLIPFEGNPRQMTDAQAAQLKASLEKFNLVEIPAANLNGTILAGHMRMRIMQVLGRGQEIIDIRVPNRLLTPEEEREYLIRSNKNTGEWDFDALAAFDENLLKDIGFSSKELDRIFDLKGGDEDDVPDAPEVPKSKLGDIYQLGEHRLMCGDSTNIEDVAKLMAGDQADMVFTDPPYNVNYEGAGKETSNTIQNDNMSSSAFLDFLTKAFTAYSENMKDSAAMYCCYASMTHREFHNALEATGYHIKQQIVWVKPLRVFGWADYHWQHEPMFYACKKNGKVEFFGGHSEMTVWGHAPSDEELLKVAREILVKDQSGESTVWKFKRDSKYKHPTQKPVELIKKALVNSSRREDVVLDLFGGSGSTLLACEVLNRRARTMELDPKYVDVIRERWEKFTGSQAEKVN